MSDVYFFTNQNRTLGPFGNCSASADNGGENSYQGPSEKVSLILGSLATQAIVSSGAIGTAFEVNSIARIAAGNFIRTFQIF